MAFVLALDTLGKCSHGGAAHPTSGNPRVKIGGQPVLTVASQLAISPCPNVVGTSPFPCVFAVYARGAERVKVAGQPVLLDTSSATNTPTGASTSIQKSQTRVKGM